ncbi:MAG: NUDIX domain-containing protein [Anaerolineaceae bacterium]|nr:NUDIX domain-containing protein [Anaerolineaceae bacterium]
MRKLIGHTPLIMIGATVLIIKEGKLLLLHRSDNASWGLPGGAIEPGETLEQTACRETIEETGLEVSQLSLYDVFSGPALHYRYPNGDEVYNVTVVYLPGEVRGEIDLNHDEHVEYRFFDIQDLPDAISPPVRSILDKVVKRLV